MGGRCVESAREIPGEDGDGSTYTSISDFWRKEWESRSKEEWYSKGVEYWSGTQATVDGVLGGYGYISDTDIRGSRAFLRELRCIKYSGVAADCGAGIGRITEKLLLPMFAAVD
uniref:Alpha N-terminal protein methyltransferase 1 n=1 Tax=Lygus hesperus TaxID=30085 RepID=A0A0A9YB24_LYGHE